MKDQESNPRPHTPRPAALPIKVEQRGGVCPCPLLLIDGHELKVSSGLVIFQRSWEFQLCRRCCILMPSSFEAETETKTNQEQVRLARQLGRMNPPLFPPFQRDKAAKNQAAKCTGTAAGAFSTYGHPHSNHLRGGMGRGIHSISNRFHLIHVNKKARMCKNKK